MATTSPTQQRFIDAVRPEPTVKLEAMRERQRTRVARRQSAYMAIELLCALEEKGITRPELGRLVSATDEQVTRWLKGKENLRFDTLMRLEVVLRLR